MMQTSLYFFFPCGWKHKLGNTLSRWREAKKHRKSSRAADVQPRGDAGREGDEDDQMAAAAETGGGNLEDTCSLTLLLWGRRLRRGRRLSWKLWRSLCWQTDVADHSSSGGELGLYSDSIHSSLKARKRPSGEVITQEAPLQGRHRRRL